MVIDRIDKRTPFEVGRIIRIQESPAAQWTTVKLTRIDPDGYFTADRI
jgi:hypothetical protein